MTGFAAAFAEGPVDFYKSQIQVQVSGTFQPHEESRLPLSAHSQVHFAHCIHQSQFSCSFRHPQIVRSKVNPDYKRECCQACHASAVEREVDIPAAHVLGRA